MQAGTQQSAEHDNNDHIGKSQEAVGNTHKDAVQPAALEACNHTGRRTDKQSGCQGEQAVADSLLSAEHKPGQHVTAQMICSQRMHKT
ncbi:hypothetical protein D3C80_1664310 [compost metagenome]